jgi:hypothetical protein
MPSNSATLKGVSIVVALYGIVGTLCVHLETEQAVRSLTNGHRISGMDPVICVWLIPVHCVRAQYCVSIIRPAVCEWYTFTERDGGNGPQAGKKLGAIAQPCHIARVRNVKRSRSDVEPNTPNPHTGRETGLNNLSRGPGKTARRGSASSMRRDVRARPTQGRVAPAKGNVQLPERPQDEGGPREARPASLH